MTEYAVKMVIAVCQDHQDHQLQIIETLITINNCRDFSDRQKVDDSIHQLFTRINRPVFRTIRESIGYLGNDLDAVVSTIRSLGIKGKRGSVMKCPIAIYLDHHVLPGCRWLGGAITDWGISYNDVQIMDYYFPDHVQEFITLFDRGEYPDLVISG